MLQNATLKLLKRRGVDVRKIADITLFLQKSYIPEFVSVFGYWRRATYLCVAHFPEDPEDTRVFARGATAFEPILCDYSGLNHRYACGHDATGCRSAGRFACGDWQQDLWSQPVAISRVPWRL